MKTIKQAIEYYESIEEWESRLKLMDEFDLVYDNKGNRETKFFKWLRNKLNNKL